MAKNYIPSVGWVVYDIELDIPANPAAVEDILKENRELRAEVYKQTKEIHDLKAKLETPVDTKIQAELSYLRGEVSILTKKNDKLMAWLVKITNAVNFPNK